MSQFSPNLKPKALHTHIDKARTLGVPKTNVVDLRGAKKTVSNNIHNHVNGQVNSNKTKINNKINKSVNKKRPWLTWYKSKTTKSVKTIKLAPALPAQPVPEQAKIKVKPRRTSHIRLRPLFTFAVVVLILILPFSAIAMYQRINTVRNSVLTLVGQALDKLKQGKESVTQQDFSTAEQSFSAASGDFKTAQTELTTIAPGVLTIAQNLPGTKSQVTNATALLSAGEHLSVAGGAVTQAFKLLADFKQNTTSTTAQINQPALTDLLVAVHTSLRSTVPELEQANTELQKVQVNELPSEYQATVTTAQTSLPSVTSNVKQLLSLSDTLITLLGAQENKRYLVLFLNNRELRACGGFIGSFAQVDINKGRVTKMDIPGGGTYDLLGNFNQALISPQPLHRVNPLWQMQDANWWADCPTSFKKVEWFYSNSGGTTVDGVIGLTPDVVEQMLAVTGPIDMTDPYGVVIDQNNFYQVTQELAEQKYEVTRESKKIIGDLTPKLLDKLFSLDTKDYVPVLQLLYNSLNEKNILLYFNNNFIQQDIVARGWAGAIQNTEQDYLQVVDTNIAGGKTNQAVQQTIQHQANIAEDGSIIDTVTITRTHYGKSDEPLVNQNNLSYLRVYTPQGSKLLATSGFSRPDPKLELDPPLGAEVDRDLQAVSGTVSIDETTGVRTNDEFNKTVFGNWVEVRPGETARVVLQYRLPFKLNLAGLLKQSDRYSILFQKQPGAAADTIISEVTYPQDLTVMWSYPNTVITEQVNHHELFSGALNADLLAGLVLAK
ncbi:MAG: DUF4012 domain-containing protein [Patescibacteria group bacterium]|jgi:hypothetical protein